MMIVQVSDFLISLLQEYMLANLMCKINKRKYTYGIHMLLSMTYLAGAYLLFQYRIHNFLIRVFASIPFFVLHQLLLFDGTKKSRILGGLLSYGVYAGLDFVCLTIYSPWMFLTSSDLTITSKTLLGRILYNSTFYLLLMILEWATAKKESVHLKKVMALSTILAVSQIIAIYSLYEANSKSVMEHIIFMTVFYSLLLMIGYFITMEMFRQIINWQKKESELEQKALEKQYQYEYYLLAYEQGEKIRDFRHDIRNQLQTIHYLMNLESEEESEGEDSKRAESMLTQLLEKVNEK